MHYKTTFLPIGCLRKALLPLVLMLFAMLAPRCSADALAIAPAIPPGTPMLILADDTQAESGAPAGVTVVTATDATLSGAPFALPKKGAIVTPPSPSGADLLVVNFSLPAGSSGVYQVWTAFTLGGVAEQSFELKAGGDGQSLTDRAAWVQSNKVSWRRMSQFIRRIGWSRSKRAAKRRDTSSSNPSLWCESATYQQV